MDLVYISNWWEDNNSENINNVEKEHILAAGNKYISSTHRHESLKIPINL